MRTPLTLLVPLLALAVAGCGGAPSPDVEPVASQAERVGALLDSGRPCEALEAMRALDTLATETGDQEVTAAVSDFISGARATVTCGPDPTTSPSPADQAPPAREDDGDEGGGPPDDTGPPDDRGNDDEGDDDRDDDDSDDDEGGPPGEARGRGNGGGD